MKESCSKKVDFLRSVICIPFAVAMFMAVLSTWDLYPKGGLNGLWRLLLAAVPSLLFCGIISPRLSRITTILGLAFLETLYLAFEDLFANNQALGALCVGVAACALASIATARLFTKPRRSTDSIRIIMAIPLALTTCLALANHTDYHWASALFIMVAGIATAATVAPKSHRKFPTVSVLVLTGPLFAVGSISGFHDLPWIFRVLSLGGYLLIGTVVLAWLYARRCHHELECRTNG